MDADGAPWPPEPYRPPEPATRDRANRDNRAVPANRPDRPDRDSASDSDDDEGAGSTRLRKRKAHRQRRLVVLGRAAAAAVMVAVLLAAGVTWMTKRWVDEQFREVAALDLASAAIVDGPQQQGDHNFLLVGTDSRKGAEAEDAAGGPRSDTVMIAHVPQDHSRVVVVSFPRDLLVDRPECERWDAATGKYTGQREPAENGVKINTAYQYGGPRCVTQVVQQLSGLAVNHFIGVDFAGFDAMVDAMGGVPMCVRTPIEDQVLGMVIDQPGTVELTGDQALDFVRAGQVAGDPDPDRGRLRRQQQFLAALARQLVSDRSLREPGKVRELVEAMAKHTVADNVDVDQLLELSRSLEGLDAAQVSFVAVPATSGHQVRTEDSQALFRAIIDGAPLPTGQLGADGADAGVPPGTAVPADQIKLQVLNGTGEGGLAGQVARRLRSAGFEVVKVDNAAQTEDRTVVRYGPAREAQARSLAAAVPGAALHPDAAMGGAVELVLGTDFEGDVEPVAAGTPLPDQPAAQAPAGTSTAQPVSAAEDPCA